MTYGITEPRPAFTGGYSMSGYRLACAGWVRGLIAQAARCRFGVQRPGRCRAIAGDTLASVLLAQRPSCTVGRSFKLHRPRGIFSCGDRRTHRRCSTSDRAPSAHPQHARHGHRRDRKVLVCHGPATPGQVLDLDIAAINAKLGGACCRQASTTRLSCGRIGTCSSRRSVALAGLGPRRAGRQRRRHGPL